MFEKSARIRFVRAAADVFKPPGEWQHCAGSAPAPSACARIAGFCSTHFFIAPFDYSEGSPSLKTLPARSSGQSHPAMLCGRPRCIVCFRFRALACTSPPTAFTRVGRGTGRERRTGADISRSRSASPILRRTRCFEQYFPSFIFRRFFRQFRAPKDLALCVSPYEYSVFRHSLHYPRWQHRSWQGTS